MTWKVTNQKTKIIINNLEELEPYIALSLKLFKTRTLELNQLFDVTIQTEFKSVNDLCKYIKVKFGLTGSGFRYTKEQLLALGLKFCPKNLILLKINVYIILIIWMNWR